MTNTERAAAMLAFSRDPINQLIAEAITLKIQDHERGDFDLDLDPIELYDLIASHSDLSQPLKDLILSMGGICPLHRCDEEICADDEITECADLRA